MKEFIMQLIYILFFVLFLILMLRKLRFGVFLILFYRKKECFNRLFNYIIVVFLIIFFLFEIEWKYV